jgi:hypothetical protein
MRYRCARCENFVKDKFIFGLLHVCLSDEELAAKQRMMHAIKAQQENFSPYLGSLKYLSCMDASQKQTQENK